MKRKLLLLLTVITGMVSSAWADFSGAGTGTKTDPYQITTPAQLVEFAGIVNGGTYDACAILKEDINMNGVSWPNSIGDWQSSHMFKGEFNGNGKSITNLTFTTARDYHGLFGVVGENAVIKDFYIDGTITVTKNSIGLVGYTRDNNVLISNIHSHLNFSGASGKRVGGIVGNANQANNVGTATIDRCRYSGTISVSGTGNYGGIVGYVLNNGNVKTTITNCLFDGTITNSGGAAECGGIAGYVGASLTKVTIKNCLSIGTVSATVSGQFYGAVKNKANSIINSYYKGDNINGAANEAVTPTTQQVTKVTDTQLANGETAYALNGNQSETPSWFQTLVDDDYPTPNGEDVVYPAGKLHCDGTAYEGIAGYSNTPSAKDDHDYADGFCSYCHALDKAYMTANGEGKFEIGNENQLVWFAAYVKQVSVAANAVLTDNIVLTSDWTTPIGTGSGNGTPGATAYTGTFDGQGYTISGFNAEGAGHIGLFGDASGAIIKNFSVSGDLTITGGYGAGVVAWPINTTIENVHATLDVDVPNSGTHHVGGLVGSARGGNTIKNCSFSGSLTVASGSTDNFAGITGYLTSGDQIVNCVNYADITFKDAGCAAGGIAGYLNSTSTIIKNCLTIGTIHFDGEGDYKYGAAILGRTKGYDSSKVVNNYWKEGSANGASKKDDGSDPLSVGSVTTAQLASGEVAYNLGTAFRQNIGTDAAPVLDATHAFVGKISAAGYATQYIADTDVEIPAGVEAFAAEFENTWLKLNAISDAIAAGEPVVLKGDEGYYSFMPTTGAVKSSDNVLQGTAEEIDAAGKYVLAKPADKAVGFYLADGGKIAAGKAYLEVPGSEVKGFIFAEDDETAINDLTSALSESGAIYNVAGQRINKLQKGINIVNGKKVLK